MSKKCWICKNTEGYFIEKKNQLLERISSEIKECELFENDIVATTAEKLGFTDEQKEKVKSIKSVYWEMTVNAILDNRNSFLQLEPNLKIVFDYIDKYWLRSKGFKTLKDIIEQFLREPVEQRYSSELNSNRIKLKELRCKREEIDNIKTFFIEKNITASSLSNDFSYFRLGFDITRKIYLCPICVRLFQESASAAFEVKESKKRAEEAAMYDDWGEVDDLDDDF